MIAFWSLLQITLVLAAVQLMDRTLWRRGASIVAVAAALVLPLFVPSWPLLRALLSSLALLSLVKVLQIARAPGSWPPRYRLWHGLAPFDVAATRPVSPSLDRRMLRSVLLYAALAAVFLIGLIQLPRSLPASLLLARLLFGAGLVYSAMEAITGTVRLLHQLAGVAVPPIQATPILSTSIREFWSQRWNRPVSGWLNEFVFRPVASKRGPTLGLVAAFGASAVLHAWMFFTAAGVTVAILVFLFFCFQALLVLVESTIRVKQLPEPLRRAWTLGLLLISSSLFVEPALRVLAL